MVVFYRRFGTIYRSCLQGSNSPSSCVALPLKKEPIVCPETSATNYHSTLGNIPEEHRSHLECGGSPEPIETTFRVDQEGGGNRVFRTSVLFYKCTQCHDSEDLDVIGIGPVSDESSQHPLSPISVYRSWQCSPTYGSTSHGFYQFSSGFPTKIFHRLRFPPMFISYPIRLIFLDLMLLMKSKNYEAHILKINVDNNTN